jgi:hypothetical protein
MKQYIITSDKWSTQAVECTFSDLVEQAKIYERGRSLDYGQEITVEETTRNGKNVVVDESGDVVAVEKSDYQG